MNELAASLFGSPSLVAPLGGERGCLGAASSYQRAVEQMRQQRGILPDSLGILGGSTRVIPDLTRFDPSSNTRVPVTQEWVDEAVAEIMRLNIELSANADPMPGIDMLKVERIWEAVRAASAV